MRQSVFLPTILLLLVAHGVEAAVISEIHYNARAGNDRLEFIEISNETSTPEDLSGWAFVEGIQYVFPPATILRANGVIVVCKDVEAVRNHYGIDNVLGNYSGNLAGSGERVTLVNHVGVVIQSVSYDDEGKWPVGPDGTGHTLSLRHLHLDPTEPESWQQSAQLGGTPGLPTFPVVDPLDRESVVLIDEGAVWRYREGNGPFSDGQEDWRQPDFDDSAWSEGATPIGNSYGDEKTLLDEMPGNYSTVACRTHFQLFDERFDGFSLAMQYEDGFCVWVNGEEVARSGCPDGADWDSTATAVHTGTEEVLFPIPREALQLGDNVMAILGLNFTIESPRFRLNPRLVQTPQRPWLEAPTPGLVFNELFRGASNGDGWVEIYNAGASTFDIGGFYLTDNADDIGEDGTFAFPASTSVEAGGFLLVNERSTTIDFSQEELRLFVIRPNGAVVAAHVFGRSLPPELALGTYSEARFPDGGRPGWLTLTPTPSSSNEVAREENLVINEIFYHPPDDPPGEPRSEFLELFNRGTAPIDLTGFRFTRGIDYAFEGANASIGPGEHLVLAKDPALLLEHHAYDGALGPYEGFLDNDGENIRLVDRLGNLVDEVRYHEGGEWSLWPAGRGASLELIDPFQDNDFGAAWDASDESEKASWEELSYRIEDHQPVARQDEFHFFLVEKGICRIDDISITRDGGANFIPNSGFEEETTLPWVIEGTHIDSHRITTDSHSGNACLEVVATGAGNSRVNRLEIDTDPFLSRGPYDVSLWARWQRGTSVIVTHGEFASPSSREHQGNTLGANLRMTVPFNLGTPGKENSVRRDNLGPVIGELTHRPPVPVDSEPVTVTARVSDADGVAEVRVLFVLGSEAEFRSEPLLDDGLHADGKAGDGVYGGEIPGFEVGTSLGFYVKATDSLGNVLHLPRTAPDQLHAIHFVHPVPLVRDRTRILLDEATTDLLNARHVHSNDLLHGTFVLNDSRVFYNVGVRYRGSPWGRNDKSNYRVRFAADQPFLRGFRDLNITTRGVRGGADEGAAYFVIGRVGAPESPTAVPDYFYVDGKFNQSPRGMQAAFQPVNNGYISKWYGENVTGPVLKADGRQQFNDGGQLADVDWASLEYKGENSEDYRLYWKHSIRQTHDDWQPFIDLCKLMDPMETSDTEFDLAIHQHLDVERFFRVHAARLLMGDGDALFIGNGHNGYLVRDSNTLLWSLLPFDIDGNFNQSTNLFQTVDRAIVRMFDRPSTRRTYYRVLSDYVDGYWSVEQAGPWLQALEEDTGLNTDDIENSITVTNQFLRGELQQLERPVTVSPVPIFVLPLGERWSFRKGKGPFSDPPTAWREPDFDDSAWLKGPTPFSYGEPTLGGVHLNDMQGQYTTVALRKRFVIPPQLMDEQFGLEIAYDDGFCAYLNGQELARRNCGQPGQDVAWNDTATGAAEISLSKMVVPIPPDMLVVGDNVIAILGLNQTVSGATFAVVPQILYNPESVVTSETTTRLQGDAPVQVKRLEARINGETAEPLTPTWTSVVTWEAEFGLEEPTTIIEITGLDRLGQVVGSDTITVVSTAFDTFQRAEVTGDGVVNINDVLAILAFLFQHGSVACLDAADVEDDGRVTVLDAIRLVLYLFQQGQEPAPPFSSPGPDPTADELGCGG